MGVAAMTTRPAPGIPWPAVARLVPWRDRADATNSAGPGLAPGERRLLTAETETIAVYATDRAIYHRNPATGWTRLGWEHVEWADWTPDKRLLTLTGLGPHGPVRVELPLPDGLPMMLLARERIRWTTLLSTTRHLDGAGEIRITARRQPGIGTLQWIVQLPEKAEPGNPGVKAHINTYINAAIAELRALAGI